MSKFYDTIVPQWKELHPYIDAMTKCEQTPKWHGEGSVLVHTKMVLDEFEKIVENESTGLNEYEINIINHALLLHDIAKPNVFVIEDGHIRAHGHEGLGAKIAYEILEDRLTTYERYIVSNLIRYHGKPVWAYEKSKEEQDYLTISMSMDCPLKLLYYVTKSDFRGRIADDTEKRLEYIEYFKELAIELECFESKFKFSSDIAKFNYLVKRTHHFNDTPYDDTKSKVILMCGFPGSGKDTLIKTDSVFKDYKCITLDDIRDELKIKPTDEQGAVIQEAKKRAKEYLAKGINFIWNATNLTRQMRQPLIQLFTDYNAKIIIMYVSTPYKTCMYRNRLRNGVKQVPDNVMEKMKNKLEIPLQIEAHEVVYTQN